MAGFGGWFCWKFCLPQRLRCLVRGGKDYWGKTIYAGVKQGTLPGEAGSLHAPVGLHSADSADV